MKKRILSLLLVFTMILTLLQGMGTMVMGAEGDEVDAFGISMSEWTSTEKEQALKEAPFGSGKNNKTPLMTKSELYVSLGYSNNTWYTGVRDWNQSSNTNDVVNGVKTFKKSGLKLNTSKNYTFLETAGIDINNTGKDEYIANLGWDSKTESVQLFITEPKKNTMVSSPITVAKGDSVKQMKSLDTYELRGALAVAGGDFDGDGVDTVITYIPTVGTSERPYIQEYNKTLQKKSTVVSNLLQVLNIDTLKNLNERELANQPMVSLLAEDIDKDGYDELIVTAGMNDVSSNNHGTGSPRLGSQIFVYEYVNGKWNQSYHTDMNVKNGGTAANAGRVVWASSTVGNLIPSTGDTVDFPEILAAGYVEGSPSTYWHIDTPGSKLGVICVQISRSNPVKESYDGNLVCNYELAFRQQLSSNDFTEGGFYIEDNIHSLLAVQAFADRGMNAEEAVFISGTVYRATTEGLQANYTPKYFNDDDDGAGRHKISNAQVQDVAAGNFNGNEYGAEQLICVTTLRQSGKNNSYSDMYVIYNDRDLSDSEKADQWKYDDTNDYIVEHTGKYYITVNAVNTDNDSTIVTLEDVSRTYSQPDVLAILESTPYFREIGDGDTGNGQTVYGTGNSSGSGSSNAFGFTAGVTMGFESDMGGGWELNIDNTFNWNTENVTTTEWSVSYANDTGENLVVVYRCPVVSYLYKDQNGKKIIVNKTGEPSTAMIPIEEYNRSALTYGLEKIDDSVVNLGTPGNPQSYRASTVNLTNAVEGEKIQISKDGWIQYASAGTTEQALNVSEEQQKAFEYGLDVSLSAWGGVFGGKLGANLGFQYNHSKTTLNGKNVTKSGSVTGQQVEGYDFYWKFVTWQVEVNNNTIPVLGYLVKDVEAPPSPAQDLSVETVTKDSIKLNWSTGERPAQQYRIYRVLENSGMPYVLVGAVNGTENSYTLTDLEPGTAYTYVVRGAAYNEENELKLSTDSSPITARTASADAEDVQIVLSGMDSDGVLRSSGAKASVTANVLKATAGASTIYQWQLRTKGNGGWMDLKNGSDQDRIGKVSGAAAKKLILENIDDSYHEGALRCIVTVIGVSGTPEYYYSSVVPLSLEGDKTETVLTVEGADQGGTGILSDPYNGHLEQNFMISTPSLDVIYEPVTVTDDNGVSYVIYVDSEEHYVGIVTNDTSTEFYAVTKEENTYQIGQPLLQGEPQYYHYDQEAAALYENIPEGFDGITMAEETVGELVYVRTYLFENGLPVTEYWWNLEDGLYYMKTAENDYQLVELPEESDLRSVYDDQTDGVFIVDKLEKITSDEADSAGNEEQVTAEESDNQYEIYTETDGVYELTETFWAVDDSGLYREDEFYADYAELEEVTSEKYVWGSDVGYSSEPGTTLTLSAATTLKETNEPVNTTIEYVITNTSNGGQEILVAEAGESVSWEAKEQGLYKISAIARQTETTLSSSVDSYFYGRIVDNFGTYESRLLIEQDGQRITETQYNGKAVKLTLQKRYVRGIGAEPGAWEDVSDVSYYVNGEALTSDQYTPDGTGNYDFSAIAADGWTASARLSITKIPLIVQPVWDGMDSVTMNTVPETLDMFEVDVDGELIGADRLENALHVECELYEEDGTIGERKGAFEVSLNWNVDENGELTEEARKLESRYAITFLKNSLYQLGESVLVSFDSSENGKLCAEYTDISGTDLPIGTNIGTSVPMDYDVVFTAIPDKGFEVEKWTVNGETFTENVFVFDGGGQVLTIDLDDYKETAQLRVEVSFINQVNNISFQVNGANGELSAFDGDGNKLLSGGRVAEGADITFQAEPAEGYMLEYWMLDGKIYTWPDTDDIYKNELLTLENISMDHTVSVSFTEAKYTQIYTGVVNTAGMNTPAAGMIVKDSEGNILSQENGIYNVRQDTALVFEAYLISENNATLREWQTSADGVTWNTVTGSGAQKKLTINEPSGEKLYVRAVVYTAQSFKLSWNIQMNSLEELPANVNITALSGEQQLINGETQPAYIPVRFMLELDDSYYVAEWSGVSEGMDKEAVLESLEEDTVVTVTIGKKPVVTINDQEGGSVLVEATQNGETVVLSETGYVDYDTELKVIFKPDTGYKEGSEISMEYVDENSGDDKYYQLADVTEDISITPVWQRLEKYELQYSVSSGEGSLSAVYERKGMDTYKIDALSSGTEIYEGGTVTFSANTDEFCKIKAWYVDDIKQENMENVFVLDNIANDCEVSVEFEEKERTVTVDIVGGIGMVEAEMNGEIIPAKEGEYIISAKDELILTAIPKEGYSFSGWSEPSEPDSIFLDEVQYIIEPGFENVMICANFAKIEHVHELEIITIEPDCQNRGYSIAECKSCDYRYVANVIERTEHSGVLQGAIAPTYSEKGYTGDLICSVCETILQRGTEIPALTESGVNNPFVDVHEGDFYFEPVLWAYENGITTGTDESHFSPEEICTRAQAVTLLWRSKGSPEPEILENPFIDVKEGTYYYKAVLWAYENGITTGTDESHFSPEETCTRAQVVTLLWRSKGSLEPGILENPYVDVKEGTYYYKAVLWAYENSITTGTDESHFSPEEICTRGQNITLIYRAQKDNNQ